VFGVIQNLSALSKLLMIMVASGLMMGIIKVQTARAGLTAESITVSSEIISQTNYRTIESDAWLNPLSNLPLNEPIFISQGANDRFLALLSVDSLTPDTSGSRLPDIEVTATIREYKLVTQWSKNELRLYAYQYERRNDCSSNTNCSGAYTERITPGSVNQGLFPISERRVDCASSATLCRVTSGPPVYRTGASAVLLPGEMIREPVILLPFYSSEDGTRLLPSVSELPSPSSENVHRVWIYVGDQVFHLDGWQGIFPIDATLDSGLVAALSETSGPIKIITPSKGEALLNQDAVENLRAIYQ
jgi:hypothetical protein